ncbi:hypothetical protein NSB1T_07860 [Coprobacter fastidiosus NSB1 = JCM 33896]|nr:hypothetical protein NSB1T_07860 [Coprobacter fastidiosus NSB1 = JCM 33896]
MYLAYRLGEKVQSLFRKNKLFKIFPRIFVFSNSFYTFALNKQSEM